MTKEEKSAYDKTRYQANKEQIAAQKKAYRQANKEKLSAKKKEYYQSNKEKRDAYNKSYKQANPEKIAGYDKKYNQANPEVKRRADHKRRALKKQVGGQLSKGITEKLMKLQRGKCAVCNTSVKNGHHLDHILPIALGGVNEDSNIQILCPTCNRSKGAKHPQDFMMSRGFLL
jgi:5-methylcytosine-specific restriction endonuclease McrA